MQKNPAQAISEQLSRFIDLCGRYVSWLVVFMVLVTFLVVVMRYLFDTGWIALQESISYMHSMVFLVGAAYTLKYDEHVRVDILYMRLSLKARAWVDLLGHLFLLLPVVIFIAWVSYPYVYSSWEIMEGSQESGGLPGVFLLKSLILVMSGLLVLQAVALILQAIVRIFNQTTPPQKEDKTEAGASI